MSNTASLSWLAVAALSAWFTVVGLSIEATVDTGMADVWFTLASLGTLSAITKRFAPTR